MADVARNLPSQLNPKSHASTAVQRPGAQLAPERFFERRMFTDGMLVLPDGAHIPYWGFEDPVGAPGKKPLPSPLIRMREGETTQVRLEMRKSGALLRRASASVSGDAMRVATFDTHIYQWKPRASGTWLYQCHTSSAREFEMGLFGLLVVDPEPDASGRRLAYKNGPNYDHEAIWIFDDVDPHWHCDAGTADAPEPVFDPQYFLVNGIANTETLHHRDVAITASAGEKVLIRMLNASYSLVKISIEQFNGSIISVDGTAIDTSSCPWSSWIPVQPDRPMFLATGSRHDLLIDLDPAKNPAVRGTSYKVTFEYLDLSRRTVRNANSPSPLKTGRAVTTITVK